MNEIVFPYIPKELIEYLEEIIPDCVPRLEDSEREIFHRTGAVHLVRMIRMHYDEQNETEQMEH